MGIWFICHDICNACNMSLLHTRARPPGLNLWENREVLDMVHQCPMPDAQTASRCGAVPSHSLERLQDSRLGFVRVRQDQDAELSYLVIHAQDRMQRACRSASANHLQSLEQWITPRPEYDAPIGARSIGPVASDGELNEVPRRVDACHRASHDGAPTKPIFWSHPAAPAVQVEGGLRVAVQPNFRIESRRSRVPRIESPWVRIR